MTVARERRVDVAVVFVHGIGRQKSGGGVHDLAAAVAKWFARYGGDVEELPNVTLGSTEAERTAPVPYTEPLVRTAALEPVHTRLTGDDPHYEFDIASEDVAIRCKIVESFWADAFVPPSISHVLMWSVETAPLLVMSRCVETLLGVWKSSYARPARWWRIATASVFTLVAFPLSALLIAVIALLSVARVFLPWKWLQDVVAKIQVALTEILGDSALYVLDPIVRHAIETQVADTVAEAQLCADEVVVVAHSQGAAVATQAIDRMSTDKPLQLLTLGSGIGQLEWLRRLSNGQTRAGSVVWLCLTLIAIATGWLLVGTWTGQLNVVEYVSSGVLVAAFFGGLVISAGTASRFDVFTRWTRLRVLRTVDRQPLKNVASWTDFRATADPVSGPPVVSMLYSNVDEMEIRNKNNLLLDHTAYLQNVPICIGYLVERIVATTAGLEKIADRSAAARHVVRLKQMRRGSWVVATRLLGIVASITLSAVT